MTPSVVKAKPLRNHLLLLVFYNKEKRVLDMKPFLSDPYWASISPEPLFNTVRSDGTSICWSNGVDLSPEDAYSFSKPSK